MSNIKLKSVYVNNLVKLIPHPSADRWYNIGDDISIILELDDLRWITYNISKYFWFDGRSGGKIPDLFEPNIGSQLDVIDWLIHDVNAYAQYFSYSDTNELLKQMRSMTVAKIRALCTTLAVSSSSKWYGIPKKSDREYINMIGNNGNITFNVIYQIYKPSLTNYSLLKQSKH